MKKKQKLLVAGGDMRQLCCAVRLSEKYDTYIIGFDKKYYSAYPQLKLADTGDKFSRVVLPVPAADASGLITCPCSETKLTSRAIADMLSENSIVLAGQIDDALRSDLADADVIDYLEREELSLCNAIPTAEGAVQIALEELPVTINELSVLIVGLGRIGTALVNILKGFGADITVAVKDAKGAAKARLMGVRCCMTSDISSGYGLIFNTVPSMIFSREVLEKGSPDALYIDLASKPGGIDLNTAAELGIKAIWALGLPGKTAPVTSGEIIADTVTGILRERGDADE